MTTECLPPDNRRATVEEALSAWEAKGATSLTVALMTDALHGVAERVEVWVVIDVGCHHCRVDSEPVGIFHTEADAEAAAALRDAETGRWRDDGQTFAKVFAIRPGPA